MTSRYTVYELNEKKGEAIFEGTAIECYEFLEEISEDRKQFMWVA